MCQADVGVSPFVWTNYSTWQDKTGEFVKLPAPLQQFGNPRPCRNFEDIVAWTNRSQWTPGNTMTFWEHREMLVLPDENTQIYGTP